jgi:hypothetical protein
MSRGALEVGCGSQVQNDPFLPLVARGGYQGFLVRVNGQRYLTCFQETIGFILELQTPASSPGYSLSIRNKVGRDRRSEQLSVEQQ